MQLAATDSALHPVVLIILVAVAIFWHLCLRDAHKTLIKQEADRRRARVLRIKWLPGHTFNKNDICFDVTLRLASGKRVNSVCRCDIHSNHLLWETCPWADEKEYSSSLHETGRPPSSFHEMLASHAPRPEPAKAPFAKADALPRIVADCERCGYGLQNGWSVCPNCGTDTPSSQEG